MKKNADYKLAFKYLLSFAGYFFITLADGKFSPFSLALLVGNLGAGLNPAISFILYAVTFIPSLSAKTIAIGAGGGAIFVSLYVALKKFVRTPSFEIIPLTVLSILPFAIAADGFPVLYRIIASVCVVAAALVMTSGAKVWLLKGVKYRVSTDEFIAAALIYCAAGYGACAAFTVYPWIAFSVLIILFCSSLFPKGLTAAAAVITAIPPCLCQGSFGPMGILCLTALAAMAFAERSKLATVFFSVAVQAALWILTDVYKTDDVLYAVVMLIPPVVYLFTPAAALKKIKDGIALYKSDNLGRYSANLSRSAISGKLYEIAAVFDEMTSSMEKLKQKSLSEDAIRENAAEEVLASVCANCSALGKCRNKGQPDFRQLKEIVSFGFAKGKLNLVDLPRAFSDCCSYPETVTESVNKLIKQYEREKENAEALENAGKLVTSQTKGLSDALKGLAYSMNKQLEFERDTEKKLFKNLAGCGIYVSEALVFGDGTDSEINLTLPQKSLEKPAFLKSIKEITGYNVVITSKVNLNHELAAVTLKRAPTLDAAFGIARATKSDKTRSGDTHSVTQLSESKFLIALNDGMGSGKEAEATSSTALSLVETFYKAGLSSDVILPTVNKLLAMSRADDFTALDLGVVDLFTGGADFIKIGSPYSFIITKDAVKIIEGKSLPLGILEEVNPTVCRTSLKSGDVIIFMSDGITDAFGSSGDLVAFLSSQKALNPKTLADNILEKALYLSGGEAKDDMTAFCVRLFDRAS